MKSVAGQSIDPVSDVLKWTLLAVAIVTFGVLAWSIGVTYHEAPPFPDRFVTDAGALLMSAEAIQTGKLGFEKADHMDYGSLYGMGSYFRARPHRRISRPARTSMSRAATRRASMSCIKRTRVLLHIRFASKVVVKYLCLHPISPSR
jgi:nitric oxide reductase large subunit